MIVTQGSCTDTSACETITGVGIAETTLSNGISIYPNPASNLVTIAVGNHVSYDLEIMDVTGKSMTLLHDRKGSLELEVRQYPAGIYFAEVKSDNGFKERVKFTIRK